MQERVTHQGGIRIGLCRALLALAVAACLPATEAMAQSSEPAASYDLPAADLDSTLQRFAEQSGLQVLYRRELVAGKQSNALTGRMPWREALDSLLRDSGLEYQQANNSTIVIRKVGSPGRPVEPRPVVAPQSAPASQQEAPVTDIQGMTVTGTRIKGAQLTSPLVAISQEDMVLSGYNNLGDALRALPQNYSGGQNPGVLLGSGGASANSNITSGSSANLRGLGPDATLTLLNGVRMAYDGYIQAVDLSVVPTAAVERVEVLLDGASAIYGSDAVGGVVNIILKRDYDGAEVSARYGAATAGGNEQTQYTGVAGSAWSSGGFLVSADITNNQGALASQRNYLGYLANPGLVSIYPEMSQKNALISGHQRLGKHAELALDAYYMDRTSRYGLEQSGLDLDIGAKVSNQGIAPSVSVDLGRDWALRLLGYSGKSVADTHQTATFIGQTALLVDYRQTDRNETQAAGMELEGALFESVAGMARLSLGGGWKSSTFAQTLPTGAVNVPSESSSNRYAYAEVDVPLVAADQQVRFARALSVNGAFRYEDYDSFGSETTPKLGAFWGITHSLDFRASWGKSFKAPTLFQQHFAQFAYLHPASAFGVAGAPPGAAVLRVTGGNPNLDPERAETTTVGIAFRPRFVPGLTVELGWFDIDYTQRVVRPLRFASQALHGPTLDDPAYSRYSMRNPNAAFQSEILSNTSGFSNFTGMPYDPATVVAFFDDREVNASSQVVRGVDLGLQYATQALDGTLFINAKGSWLTDARRALFEGGPQTDTAGVRGYPPEFKGLLGVSWSKEALTLAGTLNHIGGIWDTVFPSSPKGSSMTTLDLVIDHRAQPGVWGGLGFNLAIINALNQRPPYMQPSQPYWVSYDSTNYSALGRTISLTISKKF